MNKEKDKTININGSTKPCSICGYSAILGLNSQDSPVYACKNRTGVCPKLKETKSETTVAEELQNEGSICGSEYRAHYINRFMRRR